jgi:outer membrane protein TolC
VSRRFLWTLALVSAGGCASSPPPAADRTGRASGPGPAADHRADDPAPPAGPFTLERSISRALEANPDIGIARQRLEQAFAGKDEATAAFLPALDGRVSWTRTDDPLAGFGFLLRQRQYSQTLDPNHPGNQQDVRPDVVFQWNVFHGGVDFEHREAAASGEEAAREGVAATRNALACATAEAFFSLAKAQDLLPVAEQSVEAVLAALADARAREAVGKALAGDVLSLEARHSEAKDVLVRTRNGVELARAGLRALLALPGDVPLEIIPDRAAVESEPAPLDEKTAITRALESHPELKAARARSNSLGHEATAAWREANPLIPRVDTFATYGIDSNNLHLTRDNDNWTVGVLAEWNIFAGGRDWARARRADAQLAEARESERKAELGVELAVRRALISLGEARERVVTAGEGARAAAEAHRVVQEQFKAGAVNVTRYLEAEVALRDARAREVVARADERIARAALAKALGEAGRQEGSQP